jgi:hypothetical protein
MLAHACLLAVVQCLVKGLVSFVAPHVDLGVPPSYDTSHIFSDIFFEINALGKASTIFFYKIRGIEISSMRI